MNRKCVLVREDFRRDGLFANFPASPELMRMLAKSIPASRINIGYPAICSSEQEACKSIMLALADLPVEQAVVGHCLPSHLRVMSRLANAVPNGSANFWIPVSDVAVRRIWPSRCVGQLIDLAVRMLELWHELSDRPIDVALVDATAAEEDCSVRVSTCVRTLHQRGSRSVIICDSRGSATPESLRDLLAGLPSSCGEVEFHPHNDSGSAILCAQVACDHGITHVGTSAFGISERVNMVDTKQFLPYLDIPFDDGAYARFQEAYDDELLPISGRGELLSEGLVVTGTQRRLLGDVPIRRMRFGVTSDRAMASTLTNLSPTIVTGSHLEAIKNRLYFERRAFLPAKELRKLLESMTSDFHPLGILG